MAGELFETSPTFRQLYDKANAMKQEREARLLRMKHADPALSREISELSKIMHQLVDTFRKAVPEGARN